MAQRLTATVRLRGARVIASIGDPPEGHARRIVHGMMVWAIGERARLDALVHDAIRMQTRSSLRNAKSQERLADRIRKAGG